MPPAKGKDTVAPLPDRKVWSAFATKAKQLGDMLGRAIIETYRFVTHETPTSPEGYLRFLDVVCSVVIASTFLIKLALHIDNPTLVILILTIGWKYLASRISVKQELAIGKSLYPPGQAPDYLSYDDRLWITFQVISFMILYVFLGLLANHILVVSAIMTVIGANDLITRSKINAGIAKTFDDPKYSPAPSDKDYDVIQQRRRVARWYLFDLPHLRKEAWCTIGCASAFGVEVFGYLSTKNVDWLAYAILIFTLVANEIRTSWWRLNRYKRLKAIDDNYSQSRRLTQTSAGN
jgi:hypothetical protein